MALTATERAAKWRRQNPEKAREISRRYDQKRKQELGMDRGTIYRREARSKGNRSWLWLRSIRERCRAKGIPFDLTVDDLVIPDRCPVLGVEFVLHPLRHEYGPSLDRLIPSIGYVRGNVRVISSRANRLKSDASLEEIEAIAAYLRGAK